MVTSANFPSNYPNNHENTETIRVEEGLVIALKFTAFDIEYHSDCSYDHLMIEDGDGTTLMGKKCGDILPADIVSKSNVVQLHFSTDGSVTKSGWSVDWTARPKSIGNGSDPSLKEQTKKLVRVDALNLSSSL